MPTFFVLHRLHGLSVALSGQLRGVYQYPSGTTGNAQLATLVHPSPWRDLLSGSGTHSDLARTAVGAMNSNAHLASTRQTFIASSAALDAEPANLIVTKSVQKGLFTVSVA
jgi:hypothetical protein